MEHISAYTNHVIIRSNLMPSGIRRILSGIARLSSITLHYVRDGKVWSISDVLDFEQLTSHKTKVSIENLPLGGSQNDLHESLLDPVLTKHLVSLQLAKPTPPLTTKVDTLKRLLIQCPSLETLQYEDMGRGTQFAFGAGECLPPVSNLVLKSYDWAHSADEVEQHWDLSRIRSLSLVSVPIINFLCSISPHDLSQLTYLQAHDSLTQGLDRQEDATRGLYLLVRNYIRALEVLDITCHTRLFPIDSVMQHGDSLRELHFRDHVGFRRDDDRCPTLCPRDVAVLAENLPFLHTLELDMDASLCCPPEFLQAVSSFPMLQTLILHVQTVVHPNEADDLGRDRDYEAAIQTFSFLVRQREKTNPDMPWKCMTINVGGWRKVMLRRMSSEWRRKNACGVFAERCFVLKRDKTGQYNIQEEMCYDTSQYISSAQL
ncbi:hypothetical protein QQS21_001408 [Conoideocrella luteorostrata]|uniref:F-box domain-containing protein n=1 Tax=Conoideocrella luteorostrata TaxID=1105319 RepID=A0AAJ0CX66_9HYPO|nr:hypothetical protein QQS21_001408 [Conoideocrella luteorostrata]